MSWISFMPSVRPACTNSRLRSDRKFGAGQPRRRRPRHHADRDGDGGQGRAEHGDQYQQQHEIRQRLERLGDPHQHIVDPAAVIAGEGADRMPIRIAIAVATPPIKSDIRAP
jgi:hypothetical protein